MTRSQRQRHRYGRNIPGRIREHCNKSDSDTANSSKPFYAILDHGACAHIAQPLCLELLFAVCIFDANSEGAAIFIAAALAASPAYIFYGFVAISLVDGLAKAAIIGFLIAAFINLLSSIDLKSKIEMITVKHLKGHVIVCGYSMLAERLSSDLKKDKIHFVIIEKRPGKGQPAQGSGHKCGRG